MSISRYMAALLDAPPIRSGERSYMDCGFPTALVSRVILRSVRRARTAFWQFSRLPRRPYSGRPKPPTRPLTHNHHPPSLGRYPRFTRSFRMPPPPPIHRSGAPRFPRLYTLLVALSADLQGPANDPEMRWSEKVGILQAHIASSIPASLPPAMAIRYVVKNINLQYIKSREKYNPVAG